MNNNNNNNNNNKKKKKKKKKSNVWVGWSTRNVIHRELREKQKFYHSNECHVHKPESDLEHKMHEIPRNFEIRTDHPI